MIHQELSKLTSGSAAVLCDTGDQAKAVFTLLSMILDKPPFFDYRDSVYADAGESIVTYSNTLDRVIITHIPVLNDLELFKHDYWVDSVHRYIMDAV